MNVGRAVVPLVGVSLGHLHLVPPGSSFSDFRINIIELFWVDKFLNNFQQLPIFKALKLL